MDLERLSTSDRTTALRLLKREIFRVSTFQDDWHHENSQELCKNKMAAAGFFYTGTHDRVQCAFCLIFIECWEPGDTPMNEHRKHTLLATGERYVFCPLMAGFSVGNVPRDPITGNEVSTNNRDVIAFNLLLINSTPNPDALPAGLVLLQQTMLPSIIRPQPPRKPAFRTMVKREETFQNWPLLLKQSVGVKAMAKAGFFYTGKKNKQLYHFKPNFPCFVFLAFSDEVQCYHCKCRIRN